MNPKGETGATKMINPLLVDNFLFINGEDPQNAKRMKRKFTKKKISQCITSKSLTQGQFEKQAVGLLYEHLMSIKKNQGSRVRQLPECVGVLCDTNVLLNNITRLPPPPIEWDVLCCESDVTNYNYNSPHNNVYWCATSISDTHHFVINSKSIDAVIGILKQSKTWSSFILNLQKNLKLYTITQYYLSEPSKRHHKVSEEKLHSKTTSVEEKKQVVEEYGNVCNKELQKISNTYININQLGAKYDVVLSKVSKEESYKLLPKVSLICLLTSPERFFHTLHSFLKLDYPRDKLQLVVVDDTDAEKKLKHFLPEDSRIKIINISKKDNQEYVKLPVGYKLNTGVKYADNDIIFNFFDTHHYFVSQFRTLVKAFLVSGCDALLGGQTSYFVNDEVSAVDDVPSVANMLYNKNFWKVDAFDESYNESNIVLYNFIKNRQGCVRYAPFLFYSFEHTVNDWYTRKPTKNLQFKLKEILDPLTKESFDF